jgi:ribose transport system substrate-binding protein
VIAAAVVALSGCGSSDSSSSTSTSTTAESGGGSSGGSKKDLKVGVFLVTTASTWNEAVNEGVEAVAEEYGPAEVTRYDGEYDTNKQLTQLRDAATSEQFNTWIVNPNDGNAAAPSIEEAIEEGSQVACVGTPCGPNASSNAVQIPGLVGYVGEGGYELNGEYLAEATIAACAEKDPCNVFLMMGESSAPYEIARLAGWDKAVEGHSNINVVAQQDGKYETATALSVSQNVLQANPDLDVITTASDAMTLGAEKAVQAAGDTENEIQFIGNGAGESGISAVRDGRWFATVTSVPFTLGKIAAEMAFEAANDGKAPEKSVDGLKGYPHYITKKDAAGFEPQWKGA